MRPLDPARGLFPIGVAAEIIGVEARVLRMYEKRGLISPSRTDGNRRLYSLQDLELLEYVHYLTHVRRVNLAGVHLILEMLDQLPIDLRKEQIARMESAVDHLDHGKRQLFEQGSELVEEVLLDDQKSASLERDALVEVARSKLEVVDSRKNK